MISQREHWLRHILGCLAFSEKKFVQKKNSTSVKSLFENTMENPFFTFLNTDQNSSKKIRIEIWAFSLQIYFLNQFLTSGSGQTKKYTNMCICVFSVWPLPEVKNLFRKHIWKENAHIYIYIFFFLKSSVNI